MWPMARNGSTSSAGATTSTPRKNCSTKLVRHYFKGGLKPPFNEEKRADAGLPPDFYWPLADQYPAHVR